MNKLIIMVFLAAVSIYPRDNYSLSACDGRIYLLNGFGMELKVYNLNKDLVDTVSLKNISSGGFFDFFVKYDMFVSYLTDSEKGIIYVLDENFALKKQSDTVGTHGVKFYKKIFPTGYNSILTASYERDKIYSLTNNILKEILSFDKAFTDIFVSADDLYVLTETEISVYSTDGIFKSRTKLNSDKEYGSINSDNGNIIISSQGEITSVSLLERKTETIPVDENSCSLIYAGHIYYFSADSLKLRSVKL